MPAGAMAWHGKGGAAHRQEETRQGDSAGTHLSGSSCRGELVGGDGFGEVQEECLTGGRGGVAAHGGCWSGLRRGSSWYIRTLATTA
jgi:hypothetical protein